MSEQDKKDIMVELLQRINDNAVAAHSSRDKEVSGLFKDIRNRINTVVTHLSDVQKEIEDLKEGLENVKDTFTDLDKKTVKYDLTTTVVFGLVSLILTAVAGALIALVVI